MDDAGAAGVAELGAQAPSSRPRSFMTELADMFAGIGRILSDKEVQEAGNRFFDLLRSKADKELPSPTDWEPVLELQRGAVDGS